MSQPHDPNVTADLSSVPEDSLDAGLAAGFGKPADGADSVLAVLSERLGPLHPVLLRDAPDDSGHVVKTQSDAMPTSAQTGTRYQLAGEIACGGMGAVLRCRDVDLGRELAIKVLLEKYAQRPDVARRFVEEAQIAGQLQHPGVVPVYDLGRFGDRPFFTMKLVKGQTLAALLRDRADPAADRPRFLSIALQVAQTLAYAHAKGVIHRDLKPANVMVGAFGEVQVMDWGLAKVLAEGGIADEVPVGQPQREDVTTIRTARSSGTAGSHGSHTEVGALLGTPAYMPPKQANGDIAHLDRHADVFGLGAILCEVLTGQPPYVGRSSEEVRRKAANGDLADAHARLDGCAADAELIVLTRACLSPEAVDRPKDARAVADALTAHLDGVQARLHQAELAEAAARAQAAEEAKRRRLTLALAATVLLAVSLGGGGWLLVKGERDARQAQVTRDVHEALQRVTALREQAKAATVGGAALFAQAREQGQRALALVQSGSADAALQDRVKELQAELDEEERDRALVAALDAARMAQAETVASESRFASERAVPLYREALRTYELTMGKGEPETAAERIRSRPAAVREAVSAALEEWLALAANPKLKLDEPHLGWLKGLADALQPEDSWTRQFRAAREHPDAATRRAALERLAEAADVRSLPASALTRLASRLSEEQGAASAVQLLRRGQQQYPGDFWVNHNLGGALLEAKPPDLVEAVRYYTAAVALRPHSPGAHLNLGGALSDKGLWDEAIACYRQALVLNPNYAAAYFNLGIALRAKGEPNEAIECYRRAIALDPEDATSHFYLGNALRANDKLDEAIACYRKAIDLDPKDAKVHYNLGTALSRRGERDEAIACFRRALVLDPKYAKAHTNLGVTLYAKGLLDEAIACFRKAIALDPKDPKVLSNLGTALRDRGLLDEAIATYRQALAVDPRFATAHDNLGRALYAKGQLDEAIACYRQAIVLDPKNVQPRALLAKAERLKAARDKFPAFQKGDYKPASNDERLALAKWCQIQKLHRTAAGLYADAFAADPKLADNLQAGHRYNAACHAALAAAGQGDDAAKLDDKERVRLRQQCLNWLRADLTVWSKQWDSGPPAARAGIQQTLRHWQQDADLASVREQAALDKLPPEGRAAFTNLWADVAALLRPADASSTKEPRP